jgi:5-methylcytosine-specific restriction endonuclease McrA
MDYLISVEDAYKGATQKEPKAKRELIQTFLQICDLQEAIEREIRDRPSFEAVYERCASSNCKMVKELNALSKALADCKKALDIVRAERKKKRTASRSEPRVKNEVVYLEDPVPPPKEKAPKAPKEPKVGGGGKKKISKEAREQIWEHCIGNRAKTECPVCKKRTIRMTDFSAGHIVAEACGGATDTTNLMPICGNCNSRMGTMNLYDYTLKEFGRLPDFS